MACFCSICHETMQANKTAALLCGHVFDINCITAWLEQIPACPLCRTVTNIQNIIPIYLTSDDEQGERFLRNDFAGLIRQLRDVKLDQLSVKESERLRTLHKFHSGEISNLLNKLEREKREKEDMEVMYQKRLGQLCNLQNNEIVCLNKIDTARREKDDLSETNLMRYETLRTIHSNEYTTLKNQLDSDMHKKEEVLLEYQKCLEAHLYTEMRYREFTSNHNQRKEEKLTEGVLPMGQLM